MKTAEIPVNPNRMRLVNIPHRHVRAFRAVFGINAHTLCTAPMMDWSDRHCRRFFRALSPHARLYTEMVTTGALLHGDLARHLDFSVGERPVALQLGGSEPAELARCARFAEDWGYDEINLNCGCPSERVQRGAFGACLMREPELVAACVRAMTEATELPVTVKHRLGVDDEGSFDFVRRFVETVARAGAKTFIVHARSAWLKGLSPKENREVPPLRYEYVYKLKATFPELSFVINGGIGDIASFAAQLEHVEGVMLGRAAYHDPMILTRCEERLWGAAPVSRANVVAVMHAYAEREVSRGTPLRAITRHMLGLYHGQPNAKLWRRMLSDAELLARNNPELLTRALEEVEQRSVETLVE